MKPKLGAHMSDSIRRRFRSARSAVLSIGLNPGRAYEQPREEAEGSKAMSVVVAIHDAPAILWRCLSSLENYAPRAEIILVDDSSELRETQLMIKDFCERNHWKVVTNSTSVGHSRSCEMGSRLATRQYLCLLNSDAIVTPWSWRGIKEAFDSEPEIGIAGPSTSYTPTAQAVLRAEYCRHYWNDGQIVSFASRYVGGRPARCWRDLQEVGGFAFFTRLSVWNELGGFDRSLPDYGNEFEFCRRAAKSGWRIVWVANSYIHHLGHQSYLSTFGEQGIAKRGLAAEAYVKGLYS